MGWLFTRMDRRPGRLARGAKHSLRTLAWLGLSAGLAAGIPTQHAHAQRAVIPAPPPAGPVVASPLVSAPASSAPATNVAPASRAPLELRRAGTGAPPLAAFTPQTSPLLVGADSKPRGKAAPLDPMVKELIDASHRRSSWQGRGWSQPYGHRPYGYGSWDDSPFPYGGYAWGYPSYGWGNPGYGYRPGIGFGLGWYGGRRHGWGGGYGYGGWHGGYGGWHGGHGGYRGGVYGGHSHGPRTFSEGGRMGTGPHSSPGRHR